LSRDIVVPGDLLDDSGNKDAGSHAYKEGSKVYAERLGLKKDQGSHVEVVALSGKRYEPQRGDLVIGTIIEAKPSIWFLDINGPSDVGMHVNEVPWRVDFGETTKYLEIGDTVLMKVYHVDERREPQVTMKDRTCRKLEGGVTITVPPSKVPRIIGRRGSMIKTIKNNTDCRLFVGKNGVVWFDGEPEEVSHVRSAIQMIVDQAHTSGLTKRVETFLTEGPEAVDPPNE
jgi:exosome complex component RRP4